MRLPITARDSLRTKSLELKISGCVVIEGMRYIEFLMIVNGEPTYRSRVPEEIVMRWETLRDAAAIRGMAS